MATGTEAPAEDRNAFLFPAIPRVVPGDAKTQTHNLHNMLKLRGALVRDRTPAGHWTEAIDSFSDSEPRAGPYTGVFDSHQLGPTWGMASARFRPAVSRYLFARVDTRFVYAYLPQDQTLRMLNQGTQATRFAETLPDAAGAGQGVDNTRYYGSVLGHTRQGVSRIHQR